LAKEVIDGSFAGIKNNKFLFSLIGRFFVGLKMEKILKNKILHKGGPGPADFYIDHIEGCSHGCRFPCYGMLAGKIGGKVKGYIDWIRPKLVANALELLDQELPKLKSRIKSVHISFMTDPFMYRQAEVSRLTMKLMARLNRENIKCIVLTKGIYPRRLADLKKYGKNNEYGITLVSLDEKFKKQFEPNTSPYGKRIKALKLLHQKGLKTWVSMEPYPTPNLVKQDLIKILDKIKFVDKITFGKLNYNARSDRFWGRDDFYQKNADLLKIFCLKNKIQCHVKHETAKIRKLGGILAVPA
jgi:DNA repair photolyase